MTKENKELLLIIGGCIILTKLAGKKKDGRPVQKSAKVGMPIRCKSHDCWICQIDGRGFCGCTWNSDLCGNPFPTG